MLAVRFLCALELLVLRERGDSSVCEELLRRAFRLIRRLPEPPGDEAEDLEFGFIHRLEQLHFYSTDQEFREELKFRRESRSPIGLFRALPVSQNIHVGWNHVTSRARGGCHVTKSRQGGSII